MGESVKGFTRKWRETPATALSATTRLISPTQTTGRSVKHHLPFVNSRQPIPITFLPVLGLEALSGKTSYITFHRNTTRLTGISLPKSSILIFFKIGGQRAVYQLSGTVPRGYDLSDIIERGLTRLSDSSFRICGYNPSGPTDTYPPTHTAIIPTSPPPLQQQPLLT